MIPRDSVPYSSSSVVSHTDEFLSPGGVEMIHQMEDIESYESLGMF